MHDWDDSDFRLWREAAVTIAGDMALITSVVHEVAHAKHVLGHSWTLCKLNIA